MTAPALAVCRTEVFLLRRIAYCPTEGRRRRFAGRDAVWYGTTWACCGCGDSWTDGERHERPFKPRWRKVAIAAARRTWVDAANFRQADHTAWLREQIHGPEEQPTAEPAAPAPTVETVTPAEGLL